MPPRVNAVVLFAIICHSAQSISQNYEYLVTPFCNSSFRVQVRQIQPISPPSNVTLDHPGALNLKNNEHCSPQQSTLVDPSESITNQNLRLERTSNNVIKFWNVKTDMLLFQIDEIVLTPSIIIPRLLQTSVTTSNDRTAQKIFGLGQGNWSQGNGGAGGGCGEFAPYFFFRSCSYHSFFFRYFHSQTAAGNNTEHVVPLLRNGQTVNLLQRKFHISIPFIYSSSGYGLLFNHGGYGEVSVDAQGGQSWSQEAALGVDLWVTTTKSNDAETANSPTDIYTHYADATGHAPLLRPEAMLFWQSRNRYKSSRIVKHVASKYAKLNLSVGFIVVDYKNQNHDGDFAPGKECYPSVRNLVNNVSSMINASMMFSFWPEVKNVSTEYQPLANRGCLINADLKGLAFDATQPACRDFVWTTMLKPRYYDQGVSAFWLDETDAEGTGGQGDGNHGYDTSYGPAAFASNYWVNDWISMFTDSIASESQGSTLPLVLTRGVWAGGQRHGVVLWSSDVESTFEELSAQINLGVHAGLSGIPWWTSDVGGYGCGDQSKGRSMEYVQELMIRWYQVRGLIE